MQIPDDTSDSCGRRVSTGVRDLVDAVSIGRMDECDLESFLADTEAAVNTLQAAQAGAMVALEARARVADASLPVSVAHLAGRREEGVVDQIAVSLRCTRAAASQRYETARAAHRHAAVVDAWRNGAVDQRKVAVVCDGLAMGTPLDDDTLLTDAVEQLAVDAVTYASNHTAPQTKAWITRRVIDIDPEVAQSRHDRASAGRHVRLHPLADGMAELVAHLPAVQARRAYDTLTAAAHTLDGHHQRRTLEQRRADVLIDLVSGRTNPPQVHVNVTVGVDTLIGADSRHVDLAGYGPIPAGVARKLIASTDPLYHRLMTDARGTLTAIDPQRYRPTPGLEQFIRARDFTCRFPGCRRPATTSRSGVDLDHTVPWPKGATTPDNLAALCRHHHRIKHTPGWRVERGDDGEMTWTTPGGQRLTTRPWQYANDSDPPLE